MAYAVGTTASQFGELLFISCCCTPNLFLDNTRRAADVYMHQLLGGSGRRAGRTLED